MKPTLLIALLLTGLTLSAQQNVVFIDTTAVWDTLITRDVVHIIGSNLSGNVRIMCQQGDINDSHISGYFRMTAVDAPLGPVVGSNLILNGSDWTDSNGDGLADHWFKGYNTVMTQVQAGAQYAWSQYVPCPQSVLGQVLGIVNDSPRTYLLDFDLASNDEVDVIQFVGSTTGVPIKCIYVPGTTMTHHSIQFTQVGVTFTKLVFCCNVSPMNWIRLDNVVLREVTAPSRPARTRVSAPDGYYDMMGRRVTAPPDRGVWIEVKEGRVERRGR